METLVVLFFFRDNRKAGVPPRPEKCFRDAGVHITIWVPLHHYNILFLHSNCNFNYHCLRNVKDVFGSAFYHILIALLIPVNYCSRGSIWCVISLRLDDVAYVVRECKVLTKFDRVQMKKADRNREASIPCTDALGEYLFSVVFKEAPKMEEKYQAWKVELRVLHNDWDRHLTRILKQQRKHSCIK